MTQSFFFSTPVHQRQRLNKVFNWEVSSALLLNTAAWVALASIIVHLIK